MRRQAVRSAEHSATLYMVESEEAVRARVASKPILPSREEVRAHRFTHQPYRNWCRHCVRGRADDVRQLKAYDERAYHVISVHYTCLIKRDDKRNIVLVGYDGISE